jgi:hypothetical protein
LTVACNDADLNRKFTADDLLNVNHNVIRAIAKTLIKRQIEDVIDMVLDDQSNHPITRVALTNSLHDAKDMVRDHIADIFQDIQVEVASALDQSIFDAALKEMKFGSNGIVESVTVDVNFTQTQVTETV